MRGGFTSAERLSLEELREAERYARERDDLYALRDIRKWIAFRRKSS